MATSEHPAALPGPAFARPRMAAGDRRASILATARTVFARRGYHGASTAEIAAAAGCSEPTIYKHFPSKQALFAAVIQDIGAEMKAKVSARLEASDDLYGTYRAFTGEIVCSPRFAEIMRVRSLAVALVDEPEIREAILASVAGQHAMLVRVLADGIASGAVRPDIDPDAIAWTVVGALLTGGLRQATEGDAVLADMPRIHQNLFRLIEVPREGAPGTAPETPDRGSRE